MGRHVKVELMLERMRAAWSSTGTGVQGERDAFLGLSRAFSQPVGVEENDDVLGGIPVLKTTPEGYDRESGPIILYFHGGAFLIGSASIYRNQSSRIARAAMAQVVAVDYRLAPEHPFPAAVEDAVDAYTGLFDRGVDASRIVVAGDSAGGNLALAVAMRLRDSGYSLPAGLILLSPWVDLTCSHETMETNADARHLAQRQGLRASADAYLNGADPADPLASPLFGDLSMLPPVLIQVGSLETLLGESRSLEEKLSAAGGAVELHIYEGMPHEWHLLSALVEPEGGLDEAELAFAEIADFTTRVVGQ